MDTLAKRITARREELGLSQSDLASIAGISLTAVGKWETGATQNLKHQHLFLLSDALNVNPRWLALGEGQKVASPSREAYRAALARRDRSGDARERLAWERIAASFARAALILLALLAWNPPTAEAHPAFNITWFGAGLNTHCASRKKRARLRTFLDRIYSIFRSLVFRHILSQFRTDGQTVTTA